MIISKARNSTSIILRWSHNWDTFAFIWDITWGFCFRVLPDRAKGETWNEVALSVPDLATWCLPLPLSCHQARPTLHIPGLPVSYTAFSNTHPDPILCPCHLFSSWFMALLLGYLGPWVFQWALHPPLRPARLGSGSLPGCFQTCWCLRAVGTLLPAAPTLLQLRCERWCRPSTAAADSGPSVTGLQCLGLPGSTCHGNMNKRPIIPMFPL